MRRESHNTRQQPPSSEGPTRRSFLAATGGAILVPNCTTATALGEDVEKQPKKIAAIITEYRYHSHADVIIGKILEGPLYDGKDRPKLQIVSVFVDQFPANDMSRDLAKKYGFTIFDSIADALTLKGNMLAVDGVLCIGEHGKYPVNAKGQILYPRRRFFEAVSRYFVKTTKSVPVFNDKHLAATWDDAKWMYDRSRELSVPFLAGSSIPLTWRRPELKLPRNCDLTEAVQIGYGHFEAYGFHALEGLQCMAERRKGGESGVKAVKCLQGEEMWKAPMPANGRRNVLKRRCRWCRLMRRETTARLRGRQKMLASSSSSIAMASGPRSQC